MRTATDRPPTVLMTADAVGGVWSYALSLCAALPRIRFVVATMGPRPDTAQREALARLGNVVLEESDWRLEWMAGAAADLAPARRWLSGLARRHAVDLVHVNGYAHAHLEDAPPVLVIAHSDVLSWWQAVYGTAAPAEWDPYRRAARAGLRAADRIVAPSAAALRDVERHYGPLDAPARVIANGVALDAFCPLPKRPVAMAAGRVWDEAKNLAALDRIAGDLAWPVEIAGDTDHPESGALPLARARRLGRVPETEMARLLGEVAIFAAPARYEPFGLAILEAAAAGCALVLGDIPSLRENWDGAALFVPPDDTAALHAALTRLIADPGARTRLQQAAHRRAGPLSLARMAAAYEALYREILALTEAPHPGPLPARGEREGPSPKGWEGEGQGIRCIAGE
ncbi:MAG TPA: glycosyltransferase family 4 protein [Stellaceae bacterium]|nr:glycosyltransferase family 4 protein [Stellaceae bacterium]